MTKRKREAESPVTMGQIFAVIPPGIATSGYWFRLLQEASLQSDSEILSQLYRPEQKSWILEHFSYCPKALSELLFWLNWPCFCEAASASDLIHCITRAFILRSDVRCIMQWTETLNRKFKVHGYNVTPYMNSILNHFHQLEGNGHHISLVPDEWFVLQTLSSGRLKYETFGGKRVPFCIAALEKRCRWKPGAELYPMATLTLTVPELETHDRTIVEYYCHNQKLLGCQEFLDAYERYGHLVPIEESARLAQVLDYLLSDTRQYGSLVTKPTRPHKTLLFDPCNLRHPHLWIFWFRAIVLNRLQSTLFPTLFYKAQLKRIRECFEKMLGPRLFIEHVTLLDRELASLLAEGKKLARFLLSFQRSHQHPLQDWCRNQFPTVIERLLWEFVI